jgi:hypothetical protein
MQAVDVSEAARKSSALLTPSAAKPQPLAASLLTVQSGSLADTVAERWQPAAAVPEGERQPDMLAGTGQESSPPKTAGRTVGARPALGRESGVTAASERWQPAAAPSGISLDGAVAGSERWRPAEIEPSQLPVSSLSPMVYEGASDLEVAAARRGRAARWTAFAAVGLSAAAAFALFIRVPSPNATAMLSRVQSTSGDSPQLETTVEQHPPAPSAAAPGGSVDLAGTAPTPAAAPKPATPAASVRAQLEELSIKGGSVSPKSFSAALDQTHTRLEQCYQQTLEHKPRLKGSLVVGFTVKENGRAAHAKNIGGTLKDQTLIRCSLEAVEATRFPKPHKQAAKVTIPFQYRPS